MAEPMTYTERHHDGYTLRRFRCPRAHDFDQFTKSERETPPCPVCHANTTLKGTFVGEPPAHLHPLNTAPEIHPSVLEVPNILLRNLAPEAQRKINETEPKS